MGNIDANMVDIIRLLNSLAGIEPYSSCGGHRIIENKCQEMVGSWYISFYINDEPGVAKSLDIIAEAMEEEYGYVDLQGYPNGGMSFSLESRTTPIEEFTEILSGKILKNVLAV